MIQVTDERQEALKAGWEALSERAPHIEGNNFDGFEIKAFRNDDKVIGMLMTRGPELHVAILQQFRKRWLSQRLIREVIGGIINKYGYASTSVMENNLIGQNFVERLGFTRHAYEDGIIYYRMNP